MGESSLGNGGRGCEETLGENLPSVYPPDLGEAAACEQIVSAFLQRENAQDRGNGFLGNK